METTIITCNKKQQEPRLMANIADEKVMQEAYRQNKDLYATIASKIYHNNYEDNLEHHADGSEYPEGKKRRKSCKSILLGILYGMGVASLAEKIGGTTDEARKILDGFFDEFPNIKKWIEKNEEFARKNGYVEDIWGRRRRLPDITLSKYEVKDDNQKTSFNPLFGASGEYKPYDSPLIKKYQKLCEECKWKKDFDKLREDAKKDGITILDNTGYISQAERQCTNSVIQGCLSGDVKIITKEFGIVNIKDVAGKDLTIWDGKEWSPCSVVKSGLKQKCIIHLNNGQEIVCSPDHMFLTKSITGKYVFKKCSELKKDSRLCINEVMPECDIFYKSIKYDKRTPNEHLYFLDDIDNDFLLGQFLGRIGSDGSIYYKNGRSHSLKMLFAEHEIDVKKYFDDRLPWKLSKNETDEYRKGVKRNQKMYSTQVYSDRLTKEVVDLDIKNKICNDIFENPKLLRGFISGFFDGDGSSKGNTIHLTLGKQKDFMSFCKQIQKALLLFGIRSRIRDYKNCYRIDLFLKDCTRFANSIGFINEEKQQLALNHDTVRDGHIYDHHLISKTVEITDEYIPMYDVCNTKNGYFVADGLIVHNSAASMSKRAMIKIYNDKEINDLGFKMLIAVHDRPFQITCRG